MYKYYRLIHVHLSCWLPAKYRQQSMSRLIYFKFAKSNNGAIIHTQISTSVLVVFIAVIKTAQTQLDHTHVAAELAIS